MQYGFIERTYKSGDGLQLYFRDYPGNAPAILCLTGLSRNAKDFHQLALHLNKMGHRLICPDYRGRGESQYDPNPMNYQPSRYLNDIHHLLTLLNLHEIIIIGTSLGGILAMALGTIIPSHIKAVILNDVGPDVNDGGLKRIIAYLSRDPHFQHWADAIDEAKKTFQLVNFASEDDWQELAEASFREYSDGRIGYNWDINIVEPFKVNAPTPDLWPLFNSLKTIPLLTIRGALSDILSQETLNKMLSINPKMQYITVPDIGHVPSLNEKISRKKIEAFLRPWRWSVLEAIGKYS